VIAVADRTADVAVQVRQLFDTKASTWSAKYAPGGRLTGRLKCFATVLSYHAPATGKVLDLGCGTGVMAIAAAAAGMQATGCDISPEMLERAMAADPAGAVDWVQLDPGWRVLPFAHETFDAVVAASVMEYVDDPTAVLRECYRVLRPGGVVLCTVPDPHHPIRWLESLLGIAGQIPPVRFVGRRWSRLDGYLIYLRISKQRHSYRWWQAVATRADMSVTRHRADSAERSTLRLLTFQRPDSSEGR
jgi:SAM-dependent methyltransferase